MFRIKNWKIRLLGEVNTMKVMYQLNNEYSIEDRSIEYLKFVESAESLGYIAESLWKGKIKIVIMIIYTFTTRWKI